MGTPRDGNKSASPASDAQYIFPFLRDAPTFSWMLLGTSSSTAQIQHADFLSAPAYQLKVSSSDFDEYYIAKAGKIFPAIMEHSSIKSCPLIYGDESD